VADNVAERAQMRTHLRRVQFLDGHTAFSLSRSNTDPLATKVTAAGSRGKVRFSRWQNVTLASGNVMWFTVTSSR
jgi:hypothetical protein